VNRRELYQKAIEKWGIELQLDMMIEECAELIHAIIHLKRELCPYTLDMLREEIADVKIMIEQMEEVFNRKKIKKIFSFKLERLKQMLEKEQSNE